MLTKDKFNPKPSPTHKRDLIKHSSPFSKAHILVVALIFGAIGGYILITSLAAPNPNLQGDLNNDNTVNISDLSILLTNYGTTNTVADINHDNLVNITDLSILLTHYGGSYSGGGNSAKLRWKPPGWNGTGDVRSPASFPGYTVVDAPQNGGTLTLNDNTDYYIRLGHPTWSSGPGTNNDYTQLDITGGRNRVIIGGTITANSTNPYDDMRSLIIDHGNPAGITHIEGVLFDQSVNAITIRTPQIVQIENVRVSNNHVINDDVDTNGVHPDLIQTWDYGPATLRTDRFTGYTDYTGLSVLMGPNPSSWERYNMDLHALPPQPNSISASLPLVGGNMIYFGDEMNTKYTGSNLWMETGYYDSSYQRKLDDVIGYGQDGAPYELHPGAGLSGSVWTSANPPTSGSYPNSNPASLGQRQGDYITFSRAALLAAETWFWGSPTAANGATNGNFVPANVPGVNYISPGYQ